MPPDRCNPHRLSDPPWDCSWKCHVKPDWLLIRDWSSVGDKVGPRSYVKGVTGHQHHVHAPFRCQPGNSPDRLNALVPQRPTSITGNVGKPLAQLPVRRMQESENQRRMYCFYRKVLYQSVDDPWASPWGGACRAVGSTSSTAAATASEVMVSVCMTRTSAWA